MKRVNLSVAVVAIVMTCWSASAVPIVTESFDADLSGWTMGDVSAGTGVAAGSALWNAGGYMGIDSGAINGGNVVDFTFDTVGPFPFAGDYTAGGLAVDGVKGISFDFYNPAATMIPELSVYLIANGRTWYHALTTVTNTAAGWGTYGANLSSDTLNAGTGEWFTLGGDNLFTWTTDLASVTGIGFRMLYDTTANQTYGFDDISIMDNPYYTMVPEPQTYAMLGFAFLSMGVTFRRKLEASLASLKDMLS